MALWCPCGVCAVVCCAVLRCGVLVQRCAVMWCDLCAVFCVVLMLSGAVLVLCFTCVMNIETNLLSIPLSGPPSLTSFPDHLP